MLITYLFCALLEQGIIPLSTLPFLNCLKYHWLLIFVMALCALLSESYEEFKKNIHHLFPVLIDTKTVTKSIWKVRWKDLSMQTYISFIQ